MPKISNRGLSIPSSPIRKLAPFAADAKKRGVKVFHLNIGQPDLPAPKQAFEAMNNLKQQTLAYSATLGIAPLREKLVGYYGKFDINVTPDDIAITCGGSEALQILFNACLDPGDEIIMTEPCYANYLCIASIAGIRVKPITSTIDDGFALPSVEDFEKAITDKTKAILICNPNNPTGYLYSDEEIMRLKEIVKKHDLFLISDEVYREFVYRDKPYLSALTLDDIKENVIVVDSVSKRYSECGLRIGMIVTRNKEMQKVIFKCAQARLAPPLLGQIAAAASIEGTEEYTKKCFLEYKARRDFFIEGLRKIPGVRTPMPEGAFYTVAELPVDDSEKFCKWCLTDFSYMPKNGDRKKYTGYTIMTAPAAGFYKSDPELGRKQVRMAYVLKIEDLKMALEVLEAALETYNNTNK